MRYKDVTNEMVISFTRTATILRLLQAKLNINNYLDRVNYSHTYAREEWIASTEAYEKERWYKCLIRENEKRGRANQFLRIIEEEINKRVAAYTKAQRAKQSNAA